MAANCNSGDPKSAEECNIGKNECVDELIDDYFSDIFHCESFDDSSSESECSSVDRSSDIELDEVEQVTDADDSPPVSDF